MNPRLSPAAEIADLQAMILRSVRLYGDRLALEDLRQTPIPRLTYGALRDAILRLGSALHRLGIPERSHIALIGENRVQWSLSYLTSMCFNHVIVPIDRQLTPNEILNIIHESEATVVIFAAPFETLFRDGRRSLKHVKHYIAMDQPADRSFAHFMPEIMERSRTLVPEALPKIDPGALAEIIFTSGSLGRAKGVMLSQGNIASNLHAMVQMLPIYPDDRFLGVLPIHHTYACTCGFLCPMYSGASVHFAQSLKTILDDLRTVRATMLLAVPLLYDKMYKRIAESIREKPVTRALIAPVMNAGPVIEQLGWKSFRRTVFSELHERFGGAIRCFITGGAAQDPMVARGLRKFGFAFVQGYGLTEASPILALNQIETAKDDSAGQPLPGVVLKIDAPDHFGVGEILARGPNIMLGYHKNPAATQEVFVDGWFRTGDLGWIDTDGFLHIVGRKKNVIISKSGENVYPEEIEDILNRSPYVLESMIYGDADDKHDEVVAARVVVDAEAFIALSESKGVAITDELMRRVIGEEIAKVNAVVPGYKQIRRFTLRDQEFEKTTTQKVKRYVFQRQG
jgi:long-chain acyl-CoA synthetase